MAATKVLTTKTYSRTYLSYHKVIKGKLGMPSQNSEESIIKWGDMD
jgi:hypothetical protein